MPSNPGLASLRGAGLCALRALDLPPTQLRAERVTPIGDVAIAERYRQYKELRLAK
jgi:hypothetical protein